MMNMYAHPDLTTQKQKEQRNRKRRLHPVGAQTKTQNREWCLCTKGPRSFGGPKRTLVCVCEACHFISRTPQEGTKCHERGATKEARRCDIEVTVTSSEELATRTSRKSKENREEKRRLHPVGAQRMTQNC